jgi:hypothetical protein
MEPQLKQSHERTNAGDERDRGKDRLRDAAPDVPTRLVADAVVGVVIVRVRQVAGEQDRVRLVGLSGPKSDAELRVSRKDCQQV